MQLAFSCLKIIIAQKNLAFFSSSEAKEAFQELVTCLRFSALALGSNDCTAAEIVNVIDNDPVKLGLFTTDTDLQTCVGGRNSLITVKPV